ncbi:hypothetical protein KKC45_03090 [Patescibacteria group bacterium]|nr:hypothetical protein [Patescibacteria group bacterium]
MNEDIIKKIEEQDEKLEAIWDSVEKTRKYFLIIIWITVLTVVLPAVGLLFAIPKFLSSYSSMMI